MGSNGLIEVGSFYDKLNQVANTCIPLYKIYRSRGLLTHIHKSKHSDCIQYLNDIPAIISSPDFIGVSPREPGPSIELIKKFDQNVLIGIKLDDSNEYLYVATMYVVQESKLSRRLYSGRIKKFIDN